MERADKAAHGTIARSIIRLIGKEPGIGFMLDDIARLGFICKAERTVERNPANRRLYKEARMPIVTMKLAHLHVGGTLNVIVEHNPDRSLDMDDAMRMCQQGLVDIRK